MQQALDYSYRTGREAYDLGYNELKNLIKDNFVLALNQKPSGYFDTVGLPVGQFKDKIEVTRDGRVSINYSQYTNVRNLKFFYTSDIFELQEDRLYIKNTTEYYQMSSFGQEKQDILRESLKNSEVNKADVYSQPAGLEGAFITYSADLKTLPTANSTASPIKENGLEGVFVTYSADLTILPNSDSNNLPKEPDLGGDDNENGPSF